MCEAPIIVEDHAFTTGAVPRTSVEHVLPNTWVEYGVRNGLGCDASAYINHHFTPEELAGKIHGPISIGTSMPHVSDWVIAA